MGFFIGLLTFVLVLDCLVLILLVLMQLPKKDAGAGLAFGGGTTDALFGAGSGNVLTNATKYAAGIFFALALLIGVLQSKFHGRAVTNLKEAVEGQPAAAAGATTQPAPTEASPATAPPAEVDFQMSIPAEAEPDTSTPAPPAE